MLNETVFFFEEIILTGIDPQVVRFLKMLIKYHLHFNPPVGLPAFRGIVVGNGHAFAEPFNDQLTLWNSFACKVVGSRLGPVLRQVHVIGVSSDIIRVA